MIPKFDTVGAKVGIYMWNPNKNEAFVDDFEIRFLPN